MGKSFWDEFKDMFKTDSEKASEKQQSINDALEKEKSITEKLAALEKEYNDSLPKEEEPDLEKLFPSESGLKELEYSVSSDDDIERLAREESEYGKKTDTDALNSSYQNRKGALEDAKDKADKSFDASYKKLEQLYNELREKTENDTLKRGLGRSSIASTRIDDLNRAQMQGASELEKSYNSNMFSLDTQIEQLEADRENALNDLDLKYAVQLDERINELKKERDATVKKYEEYNANIREKEKKFQKQREEDIADFLEKKEKEKQDALAKQAEHEKIYGYSGAKQENYAKRYDIAFEFYSSLSPEIAVDALQASPSMKYYLGQYYDKLLSALKKTSSADTEYIF